MKLLTRIFLLLIIVFAGFNARATHIAGGDIQYQCLGNDSFLVTLNLFRYCGINNAQAPQVGTIDFVSSCGQAFTVDLPLINPGGTEISQLCPTAINNSSCNGGTLPGMQHYIYQGIVTMAPPCNSWTMSWRDCCRNSTNNVNGQPWMYFSAQMNSGTDNCNDSPTFTSQPIPYVCQNQVVNYNFGVIEPNNDSLVYSLVSASTDAGVVVPYNTGGGFSSAQPFGTNVNVSLNAATGQLTFTPNATGIFIVVIRVDEYDPITGAHLGYVLRDIQIVVQPCNNVVPVVAAPGMTNISGNVNIVDSNSVELCVGDSVGFDIIYTDADILSPGDSITLFTNIMQVLGNTATVTITNGNPAIIHVDWIAQPGLGNFLSFNITAIDDACDVPGLLNTSFDITILPSTYAGEDQTICQGTQSATLIATGGSQFVWNVISGDPINVGVNFSCDTCDTVVATPNITTTYEVVSNLSATCSNRDTVTVFVAPNYEITLPSDTVICAVSDFQLFVNTDQPSFTYTYDWKPASTLSDPAISNPIANPIKPTTYEVTVTSAAGCEKTGDVTITLSPPFPENNAILGDTVICIGSSTQLELAFGQTNFNYCGTTTAGCLGASIDGVIGTGTQTNSNSSYPAVWAGSRRSVRNQFLYYASELQAMGMANGGQINSIAFDIATVGAVTQFQNFTVKLKCSNLNDLSASWDVGLTEVIPAYTHTVTAGWNVLNLTTPYYWDGVSNLVVEVCYDNAAFISNTNSQNRYTSTLNQTVRYATSTSQGVCMYSSFSSASNQRPNIQINYCGGPDYGGVTYQWTPNVAISDPTIYNPTVTPTVPTTYQLIIKDTLGACSDTITHFVDAVTQFDAGFSITDPLCVSSDADTAMPNVGGGTWSGVGIIDGVNGVFDPAAAGIGTHQVTYSIPGTCANDSTIDVNVIALPDASIQAPDDYCISGLPLALTSANTGGVFSGPGVTGNTFDPSGLTPGVYTIKYQLVTPCPNLDSHDIKLINPYDFSFNQDPVLVCDNDTAILAGNYTLFTGALYGNGPVDVTYTGTGITDPDQGHFNGNGLTPGDYPIQVTVTDTFGNCGVTKDLTVKVQLTEYAAFTKDTYCSNESNQFLQLDKPSVAWENYPVNTAQDSIELNNFNQFSPSDYGAGKWVFEFEYTSANGCVGINIDTLFILNTPDNPNPFSDDFCENEEVILEASGSNADSIYWEYRTPDTISLGYGTTNNSFGLAPAASSNPVKVYVKEVNGICESDFVEYILPIHPAPTASFLVDWTDTSGVQHYDSLVVEGDTIYGNQQAIWVRAQGFGSTDSLYWDLNFNDWSGNGDVIINAEGDVPSLPQDFNSPGLHELLLVHTNEYGCQDQYSIYLEIIGTEQLANIFTPNGDGINDLFYVIAPVRDFTVEIFNRWGEKIYEYDCDQCSQKDKGWNGGDHSDGTYFFIVRGKYNDGSDYVKKGTVTLTGGN